MLVVTFTEVAQNSPMEGCGRFGAQQTGYEQGLPVILVLSPFPLHVALD